MALDLEKLEQDKTLNLKVGTIESSSTLPEAVVEIVGVRVDKVGEKKTEKLICICRHPSREETIEISSLKFEKQGSLAVSGLWVNKDEDENIKMNSGLGVLMNFLKVKTLSDLTGNKIQTVLDEKNYLTLKAY